MFGECTRPRPLDDGWEMFGGSHCADLGPPPLQPWQAPRPFCVPPPPPRPRGPPISQPSVLAAPTSSLVARASKGGTSGSGVRALGVRALEAPPRVPPIHHSASGSGVGGSGAGGSGAGGSGARAFGVRAIKVPPKVPPSDDGTGAGTSGVRALGVRAVKVPLKVPPIDHSASGAGAGALALDSEACALNVSRSSSGAHTSSSRGARTGARTGTRTAMRTRTGACAPHMPMDIDVNVPPATPDWDQLPEDVLEAFADCLRHHITASALRALMHSSRWGLHIVSIVVRLGFRCLEARSDFSLAYPGIVRAAATSPELRGTVQPRFWSPPSYRSLRLTAAACEGPLPSGRGGVTISEVTRCIGRLGRWEVGCTLERDLLWETGVYDSSRNTRKQAALVSSQHYIAERAYYRGTPGWVRWAMGVAEDQLSPGEGRPYYRNENEVFNIEHPLGLARLFNCFCLFLWHCPRDSACHEDSWRYHEKKPSAKEVCRVGTLIWGRGDLRDVGDYLGILEEQYQDEAWNPLVSLYSAFAYFGEFRLPRMRPHL